MADAFSAKLEYQFQKLQLNFVWGASARQEFYSLMADFISDGVAVYDALDEISVRWRETKSPKAIISQALLDDLRGGSGSALRLGQALSKWAPSMESIAIDAGEQAGDVAQGLRMAANLTAVKARVKKTIIGEMIYPAVLIALFCGVLVGINSEVVPILDEVLPRDQWPAVPAFLGKLADSVGLIVTMVIGTIVGVATIYSATAGRWVGSARDVFDKFIFPWSMNRQINGSIMLACFSALMRAQIPLSEIIAKMSAAASTWEKTHLFEMRDRMRQGMADGDSMATELFDEQVRWVLGVYGKLSSFSKALSGLSDRQIEETLKKIQTTMTLIRTLCMVGIAGMVVLVYFSFMQITMAAKSAGAAM